jgi:transcriptional regulator with XRE-family HTH domain
VTKRTGGRKPREGDLTPSQAFGRRLRQVRKGRRMSGQRLTELLDEYGFGIHRTRLARIESGETPATLEDLFALAFVLDASPSALVVPEPDELGLGEKLEDEAGVKLLDRSEEPGQFRAWVKGEAPLDDQDPDLFELQRPLSDLAKQYPHLTATAIKAMTARQIATYRLPKKKETKQ